MKSRFTLLIVLVAISAQAAMAQSHTNRRRGALLGGLAGAAIGAAIGDKGNNETAGALIGGAVGAVAGGTIGDAKDQRIEHNRIYHSYPHGQPSHVVPAYPTPVHPHSVHTYPVYPVDPGYQGPHRTVYPYPTQPIVQPLTTHDVVTMVRSGLSEMMVINQIRYRGMAQPLRVSEVIGLHEIGISEPILEAMQGM